MSQKSSSLKKCFVPMESHQVQLLKHKVDDIGGFVLLVEPGVHSFGKHFVDARLSLYLAPDVDVKNQTLSVKVGKPDMVASKNCDQKFRDGFEFLLRYLPAEKSVDKEREVPLTRRPTTDFALAVHLNPGYDFVIGRRKVSIRHLFAARNLVVYIKDVESIIQAMWYALEVTVGQIRNSLIDLNLERYELDRNHVETIINHLVLHCDKDPCTCLNSDVKQEDLDKVSVT